MLERMGGVFCNDLNQGRGVTLLKKLKLLLIMNDFSQWGNPKQYFLGQELAKITDLIIWSKKGNIHEILEKIPFKPDFILIMYYKSGPHICPPISGLNTLKIPFGVFIMDLHNLNHFEKSIKEDGVQYIFSCYRDPFLEKFPELENRMIWFPHHVNTDIFKDYGLKKEIDMLMMGFTSENIYPLRHKIRQSLSQEPNFVYHHPPNHREITDHQHVFVRERYAREINRAKLFFTCDSIFHYTVLKHFEVPACHTLLLAPESQELHDLGFKDGENYIAINEENFKEKALYYLQNDEERERITKNGYQLVHQRHSTKQRAKELVQHIEKIIHG